MPKIFEVAEAHLYSFLDTLLKAGGMAVHAHISQFLNCLKEKEAPPAAPPAAPAPASQMAEPPEVVD